MNPELEFIKAAVPALMNLVGMIVIIAYTKKTLFEGVIPKNLYDEQMKREGEAVSSIKETATHLEEIGRQLEQIARTVSEELKEHSEQIRELTIQCEKHRKNVPETEVFLQRRKPHDQH